MEIYFLICTLKRSDVESITLILPYFPYSRSDKKDNPRGSICSRDIAKMLESAGVERILELHSPQIQGFYSL